jgi:hypothetical protein
MPWRQPTPKRTGASAMPRWPPRRSRWTGPAGTPCSPARPCRRVHRAHSADRRQSPHPQQNANRQGREWRKLEIHIDILQIMVTRWQCMVVPGVCPRKAILRQGRCGSILRIARPDGSTLLPVTAFEKGKLKIAAHAREELDRAGISFQSIQCKSGGIQTHPDTARLTVTVDGSPRHVDLNAQEVEECESIVAGDTWYRIAAFIERLR